MTPQARIAIFASGSGTNAREIINFFRHHASIEVALVLSNNASAFVLNRAEENGIPSKVFDRITFRETEEVLRWLQEHAITHVVLAGFLWLVPEYLLRAYPNHIINIHPALLPKHGGKGMYGMRVHEAVKLSGDKQTGITIHLVNERYDEGKVLFQGHCDVQPSDTPEMIADKIHALEYKHYPKEIEKFIVETSA